MNADGTIDKVRNKELVEICLLYTSNPRPSVQTIANAMDVGDPSNFIRVIDLYEHSWDKIKKEITGEWYDDDTIRKVVKDTYEKTGYLLDPHGACGYSCLLYTSRCV